MPDLLSPKQIERIGQMIEAALTPYHRKRDYTKTPPTDNSVDQFNSTTRRWEPVVLTGIAGTIGTENDNSSIDTAASIINASTGITASDAGSGQTDLVLANHPHTAGSGLGGQVDHTTALTNVGNNSHARVDSHLDNYNGTFLESFRLAVTSNGTTITGTLDKNPTGDLTQRFSDGYTTFSSGGTVAITDGSATAPAKRYIHILQSSKTVLREAAAWPATEHIKVAEVVVQTAALVQSDGVLANRNWNDHAMGGSNDTPPNQGHHTDAWYRLRWEHAAYMSGGALSWAGSGTGALNFDVTATVVFQMHPHTTDAFDTTTPAEFLVVNQHTNNGGAYDASADIEALVKDSADGSLTNRYYNLVIWGSVSSGAEQERIFVNLPGGAYTKQGDATDDVGGFDVFDIPSDFRGYAYLIQRTTIRNQADSTFTIIQETDLRGTVPNIVAGGGTAAITTEFADNQFRIFDDGNPTKLIAFQASGITAGQTRVVTVQDADGTIAYSADLHTQAHAADHTDGTDDIRDAVSDGSTKGIATFKSADFDDASGVIDLADAVCKGVAGDSGVAIPVSHGFSILGGAGIDTIGGSPTGDDVTISAETATKTNAGISELATTAEIDTGTDTGRTMPIDQFVASARNVRFITIRVLGPTENVTVDTEVGGDWVCPFAGTLLQSDSLKNYLSANVDTAGITGTMVVDIHKGGTTVMATNKLDIETTEKSTNTATTQPDLTVTAVTAGDVFTFDIDAIHSGTAAKGLSITIAIRMT